MREKAISYAAHKNVATKKRKEMLECEIPLLEKHLDNVNNSNSYHIVAERIFSLKKELENIISIEPKALSSGQSRNGTTRVKRTPDIF